MKQGNRVYVKRGLGNINTLSHSHSLKERRLSHGRVRRAGKLAIKKGQD